MTTQRTTTEFITALNRFAWVADYSRFCEVLGFEANSYSEEKYKEFRELVSYLARFDAESLEKLLEAGE